MSRVPNAPEPNPGSRQSSSMPILFGSILAIGLLLAINFSNRITAGQRIQQVRDSLEMEIATLEAEQASLLADRDYARSDEYVISWAHSEGKMVREGEVLVIPVPEDNPIPSPTPEPQSPAITLDQEPEAVPSWRLWWALFFDGDPPF